MYLDSIEEDKEKGLWTLNKEKLIELKDVISENINFNIETQLLVCKAELICNIYKKIGKYDELIQNIMILIKRRDA